MRRIGRGLSPVVDLRLTDPSQRTFSGKIHGNLPPLPISHSLAGISIGNGTKNAAIYCAIGSDLGDYLLREDLRADDDSLTICPRVGSNVCMGKRRYLSGSTTTARAGSVRTVPATAQRAQSRRVAA